MSQNVAEQIEDYLNTALSPSHLEIIDESALHAGHAGSRPGGESHFRIVVVTEHFDGVGRVQRQQLVYGALEKVFEGGLHALSMVTMTPEEYEAQL